MRANLSGNGLVFRVGFFFLSCFAVKFSSKSGILELVSRNITLEHNFKNILLLVFGISECEELTLCMNKDLRYKFLT